MDPTLMEQGNLRKQWMVYLFVEWVSKLIWCKSYSDQFGNSQHSLLSPTGGVMNIPPTTERHRLDFKEELSSLRRLKNQEDRTHPSQVMSPTSWPSASSTTLQVPSPTLSRHRTRTWMTWHSASCSGNRGQADYCEAEGMSVSQSSSSGVFDRARKPVGERDVDQSIGFGVTRNTYSAHSKFSENTQAEKVVDRSGKPEERVGSNAQIRTLLKEQRQMIMVEYCEKIGHHELQAAHAEEERRILREELWRQQMEFREVHQQSLTEMEEYENSKVLHSIRSQEAHRGPEHYHGIVRQSTGTAKRSKLYEQF